MMMRINYHIGLACFAIVSAAVVAEAMIPRTSMARAADALDLEKLIPKGFGQWKPAPDVRVVEPPGSDALSREIYNQEIARGYADAEGHVVMLLIAYGASQSDRLQLHRPEICYVAQGFAVSRPTTASVAYDSSGYSLEFTRLVAQREGRLEPVTYWMRIGDDIANGVVQRQILKVTYGLHGLVPDGALIRVSTIGLPEQAAFAVQSDFIRDLIGSAGTAERTFLVGNRERPLYGTVLSLSK